MDESSVNPVFTGNGKRVSVVIPVYNEDPEFLEQALQSVLDQSVPPHEIIVVEDGALRDYAALWARYPQVRVLKQANAGPSAARNNGLAAATGEFVQFLDGDDRLRPHALAVHLGAFAERPEAIMSYGRYLITDGRGTPRFLPPDSCAGNDTYAELLKSNFVGNPDTVLFRRDALLRLGGFDARFRGCEDWELFLRTAYAGEVVANPEIVAEYRQHDNNCSSDRWMMVTHHRRMLEAQLDRVRSTPARLAAWRQGLVRGRIFFARQQCADLIQALRGKGAWGPAMRAFFRFAARMPFLMTRVVLGEVRDRLRRRLRRYRKAGGTTVAGRYIDDFVNRYTRCTRGEVVEVAGALPARAPASCDCIVIRDGFDRDMDPEAALPLLHRMLRPAGVLLLAVTAEAWSPLELERLLGSHFNRKAIDIGFYGNPDTADGAHKGRAAESFAPHELYALDASRPVIITASAHKANL